MISKWGIVGLLAFHVTTAQAFDVCDKEGFKSADIGWIRTISVGEKVYVDFKVNTDELSENGLEATNDVAPSLAKDAASAAYYKLFKSMFVPDFDESDLVYGKTEAFLSTCWLKKTYGYRTPLSTFHWVQTSPENANYLPPIREFLKKKQLID